ncbi:MAG TPA: DUF6502 family protein [Gammaproteobacteria bacterium]
MECKKNPALAAFRLLFRPVARILLRDGIDWKELAAVGKSTYVEVATESFGIRGRPTNVSRVAILTGLTRREVRRLRERPPQDESETFGRMNHATRVLSGWYQNEEFSDGAGAPRPLPLAGEGASFERLCARYAADVPATTMLKELRHVGAVEELPDGRVVARTRYYLPVATDPERVLRSGSVLADLARTVEHNLHPRNGEPARFERRATNTHMPASAVAEFRKFIEAEAQAFLERVDAWLTAHEHSADDGPGIRLGLGVYWIQDDTDQRKIP